MLKMLFDFVVVFASIVGFLVGGLLVFFSWLNLREEPKS